MLVIKQDEINNYKKNTKKQNLKQTQTENGKN